MTILLYILAWLLILLGLGIIKESLKEGGDMFGYFRNHYQVKSIEIAKGKEGFEILATVYDTKTKIYTGFTYFFSTQEEVESFVKGMGKKKWII